MTVVKVYYWVLKIIPNPKFSKRDNCIRWYRILFFYIWLMKQPICMRFNNGVLFRLFRSPKEDFWQVNINGVRVKLKQKYSILILWNVTQTVYNDLYLNSYEFSISAAQYRQNLSINFSKIKVDRVGCR